MNNNNKVNALYSLFLKRKSEYNSLIVLLLFPMGERMNTMGDSSQFSPLTTLSEQLGPNSLVSSVFIPAFIANIGKHFFLKYDSEYSKSI